MRRINIYVTLGILLTLTGIILLIIRNDISRSLNLDNPIILSIIAGLLILYGIGIILFVYLQFYRGFNSSFEPTSERSIRSELEALKLELYRFKKNRGKINSNSEEINSTIDKLISENLENQNLLSIIESKFGDNIREENKLLKIEKDFASINKRIELEINRLSKSGSLNLVFGSLTTIGAVSFLGYEVIFNPISFNEIIPLLSHYIPRLTLVIFVEIFAFFFLKIYKTNLNDIKYFHNEKTNIDFKIIAIKSALLTNSDDSLKVVIEELSRTERNFVLKKGDSTIEIEKEKINNNSNNELFKLLRKIAK